MKKICLFICTALLCLSVFSQEEFNFRREFNAGISNSIPMLHPHISFNADESQI